MSFRDLRRVVSIYLYSIHAKWGLGLVGLFSQCCNTNTNTLMNNICIVVIRETYYKLFYCLIIT